MSQIRYDVDGDTNWDYTESPGDGVVTHTFTSGSLGVIHSRAYNSIVEVTDSQGTTTKDLYDFGPMLQVTHAVPHLVLTVDPESGFTYSGVSVEFDASESYDIDGPNGKPTRYEFDFGDGSSYYEEDGDADDGTFDGITTHTYGAAAIRTATVAVFDAMYNTNDCINDELHTDNTTFEVRIFGNPVLISTDTVDDGIHHGTTWSSLGNEPIAVDINPSNGLPAVVYYGIPASPPVGAPMGMPLFSEMTELGWPSDPDLVYISGQGGWWVGEQCDLEYDTKLYDENTNQPKIAATARANNPGPTDNGPDLLLYRPGASGWQMETLIDDENVSTDCNLRLVSNQTGSYVHYVRVPLVGNLQLCEIADRYGTGNERVVESGGNGFGLSHDFKQFQDDYTDNENSSIYIVDSSTDYISYEKRATSDYWTNSPTMVSSSEAPRMLPTRLCALDFFQDSGLGVVWVDTGQDLNWNEYDGDWNNQVPLANGNVGKWCDFDYDEDMGIPCVAYEQEVTILHSTFEHIYLRAYVNGSWCSPVTIDVLPQGQESHLDLDIWNGYIYVAYSKSGSIKCAKLDLFNGVR